MLLPPRGDHFQSHREHTNKIKIERKQEKTAQKNCLFLILYFFNNKKKNAGFPKQQFLLLFYIKMR